MIDNSLCDANYYEQTDYVGFGKRLIVMLIDSIAIVVIGIILWIPFLVLILAEVIQSDPSGIFWLAFLAAARQRLLSGTILSELNFG